MKVIFGIILSYLLLASCATKSDHSINKGRTLTINDRKLYFEEYGQGAPLIVLSGGGLHRSIKDFEKCIPSLSQHYRVILPDTPGQGRSEQTDSLSYNILTDVMSQLIDSLNLDSTYVMGLSDGGIVSLLLAEGRPDKVRKAIAVGANNGTRGFVLPDGFDLDSVKMPSVDQWAVYHKEDIESYNALQPKKDWRKMAANLNLMWYAKEYFPSSVYDRINIPVMIVLGDRDDISIDHGQEMYRLIKGSQLCILPNTSHEVFAERPEIIATIATEFFK
jgi:pimeloyl-ACP methyl ester carboxylesterase